MRAAECIGLANWRHVVKLDPDKPLPAQTVRRIAASGTHAVLIGGTQRLTRWKVLSLLRQLRGAPVPVVIEVSSQACAIPGADAYFVPIVLNAGSSRWLIDEHLAGLRRFGGYVPWSRVLAEGYVIGHTAAAVARQVGVRRAPQAVELAALVRYGAGLLQLPIVYLEYSGRLAPVEDVAVAARVLRAIRERAGVPTRLFYGGGIDDFKTAFTMLRQVDTIVVGNALYRSQPLRILEETLAAAATAGRRSPGGPGDAGMHTD